MGVGFFAAPCRLLFVCAPNNMAVVLELFSYSVVAGLARAHPRTHCVLIRNHGHLGLSGWGSHAGLLRVLFF